MKLKNNKGVTLMILTITIIVLLIITGFTFYNSKIQLALKNVNNLYKDIDNLNTKISAFYLKNDELPIVEDNETPVEYISSKQEFIDLISNNSGTEEDINPNDGDIYYIIDLEKIDNLTLNYGKDYYEIKENLDLDFEEYQNLYVINDVTHQIYYIKGIHYKESRYFSKEANVEEINNIENIDITTISDFDVNSKDFSTIVEDEELKIIVSANITLNIDDTYEKSTLQYAWEDTNEDEKSVSYTNFELASDNTALLTSKKFPNSIKSYFLYLKFYDKNGNVHYLKKEIILDFVGYYADIDDDGEVDGIIYADLAVGNDKYYSAEDVSILKSYNIKQNKYDGVFGKKEVLVGAGEGNDRFYVMALNDVVSDGTITAGINSPTWAWYYSAYNDSSDIGYLDSAMNYDGKNDFGKGKSKTKTMIEKWNVDAYGIKNGDAPYYKDIWSIFYNENNTSGTIDSNIWFIPSVYELKAFKNNLKISNVSVDSMYYNKVNLSNGWYWSSSQYNTNSAFVAHFDLGEVGWIAGIGSIGFHVRLSTTF